MSYFWEFYIILVESKAQNHNNGYEPNLPFIERSLVSHVINISADPVRRIKTSGTEIKEEGEEYLLLTERDILAKVS